MMMKAVLKTKVWILFLVLLTPLALKIVVKDDLSKQLLWLIEWLTRFGYYLFVYQVCKQRISLAKPSMFYISLLVTLLYILVGLVLHQTSQYPDINSTFIGNALMFVLDNFTLYWLATIYMLFTGERGSFGNYIVQLVLFGALPIGIWFIHPKLQRAEQKGLLKRSRKMEILDIRWRFVSGN